MAKKRKSRASAGNGEDSKKRSKSTSTAMERQISGSSAGQASAQSTTADSEQEETCPLCPSGKPPQPSAYPPEIAGKGDTPAMLRQAEKEGEDGIDLPWIGCTKCKTWYHAACLVLDGMPTLNAEAARNGSGESEQAAQMQVDVKEEETGAPQEEEEEVVNGRKTLPEELLTTVDERGYWWDWTYRVDKWYCPPCHQKTYGKPPRPYRSTMKKRTWDSPEPLEGAPSTAASGETSSKRPKRAAALNAPDYHALHNHISTPTTKWLGLIKDPKKTNRKISDKKFPQVHGSVITKAWLDGTATATDPSISPELFYGKDRQPIIIPREMGGFESLGGKLPAGDLGVKEVAELVGKDVMVPVIDVATQISEQRTLGWWADYATGIGAKVERPSTSNPSPAIPAGKVYNVISLEITGSKLAKQVKAPDIVSEIDWVDQFWPKDKRQAAASPAGDEEGDSASDVKPGAGNAKWPKVQLYCLMGMKGSWTDWHVDFAASSVYYTIHSGSKVFYVVRPTDANLAAYAKWSGSHENQQNVWLGDWVDEVRKVTLRKGDTLILPAGYIHAVYTPEDTLVFGGNFVHSYCIETQLRLRDIENETKVPQRFRFPYFDKLCWYVADRYTQELRQASAFRPTATKHSKEELPGELACRRVQEGLLALARFLIKQSRVLEDPAVEVKQRKLIYDRIPHDKVKDPSGLAHELQWRVREAMGEGSDDEEPEARSSGRPVKRQRSAAPVACEITFGPRAPTKHLQESEWEVISKPVVHNVTTLTAADSERAIGEREVLVHEQKRRRRRDSDGAVVQETQQVIVTTTVERFAKSEEPGESGDEIPLSSFHEAVMAYGIKISERCPVSRTAFSVGSIIVLPSPALPSSTTPDDLYDALSPAFKTFSAQDDDAHASGLILSEGYSREVETRMYDGKEHTTHAEANALVKFEGAFAALDADVQKSLGDNATVNGILRHAWLYATLEPCSVRTSGGPSCAQAILDAGVKRVLIGVQEPPDFVQCEGIRILRDGGVDVEVVPGMQEQCLAAARRGRE